MPYLAIDHEKIAAAWDMAVEAGSDLPAELSIAERQDFGRRAVIVHLPQSWPHGTYCFNCGGVYPCTVVLWGMRLLKANDWELADVIDLIESRSSFGESS